MQTKIETVAVVSMGEMGAAVAARLVQNGVNVVTLGGRSEASLARARAAGVSIVTESELVARAQRIFSIVPPHAALETARAFSQMMAEAKSSACYIDLNAIAPQTLEQIYHLFATQSLAFADGGIIGAPPAAASGTSPRVYMSGDVARDVDWLQAHGLHARHLSNRPGDASALKMAYAGITKGLQALATASITASAEHDVLEALRDEMQASLPHLHSWLQTQLPKMPAKAYRWDGEMREIGQTFGSTLHGDDIFAAAADLYQVVAKAVVAGDSSNPLLAIKRFTTAPSVSKPD